jgi:acyl-CoA thioesterase-1
MFRLLSLLAPFLLLGCGEPVTKDTSARILLLGDSMFAANAIGAHTVTNGLETALGEEVIDRSVIGARYFYPLPFSGAAGMRLDAQYRAGKWDWVVMNGGGNDLLFGCGCGACDSMLNRLVTADGKEGAISAYIAKIRTSGARVVYAGYLRNPGFAKPIRACGPAGNELDQRLAKMADLDKGVFFISMADLVPMGDSSYHQFDRIHPSPKGSRAIADRIAKRIKDGR